jgi:Putative DNA-binding domain
MYLPTSLAELIDFDPKGLKVSSRESSHREFKQLVQSTELPTYCKSLVAFGNSGGGVILFGITNVPRAICGIDLSTIIDEAKWVDFLRTHFDPVLKVEAKLYEAGNRGVLAVAVGRAERRPILCRKTVTKAVEDKKGNKKDVTILQEGMVYYRYAGQTRPIGYADMVAMLEERDAQRMRTIMENFEVMERIGFDRVGIVDASLVGKPGTGTKLYMSRETAKHLNFIEKGRFVESEEAGAPAYVVAGTVELHEVVHAPLDDADKNLPDEAAALLRPHMQKTYWKGFRFAGSHLAKLAAHLSIRKNGACDPRYCVEEKKLRRVFYTRAGLDFIRKAVSANPDSTLKSFASKPTIEQFEKAIAVTKTATAEKRADI